MLNDLNGSSKSRGLKINKDKTKVMINKNVTNQYSVKLEGTEIMEVENYTYLGQNINLQDNNQSKEVAKRIQIGWATFGKYSYIMKSDLPVCLKRKVFNQMYFASNDLCRWNMDYHG